MNGEYRGSAQPGLTGEGGGSVRSNCRAWYKARQVQEGQGGPGTVSLLRKTLFGDPGYPGGR